METVIHAINFSSLLSEFEGMSINMYHTRKWQNALNIHVM